MPLEAGRTLSVDQCPGMQYRIRKRTGGRSVVRIAHLTHASVRFPDVMMRSVQTCCLVFLALYRAWPLQAEAAKDARRP